ncbi:hypothetical protein [Candidatus Avelusimicrobium luingense]|uniref:hypothetical protein n=1 Tax=Candidatus Avelusimicrobium luingense TaxID=3416211 RepID=UPI003D0E053A
MKKIGALLIFITTFTLGNAQEIAVQQVQAPAQIPFAQPFDLSYRLSYTPDYEISLDKDTLPEDFEITQSAFTPNGSGSGVYTISAIPFALNQSTFTVTFLLTKNGKTAAKTTHDQPITVTPVKIFNDKKLREIRAAYIPIGWLAWLIAFLVTVAIIYALYCWANSRKQNRLKVAAQEDTRPCDEIALSKIDALLNSGLWERKAYKLFYISLSDILREYLWRQLHIDTSADTSAELLLRAKKSPALQPLLPPLKDFLASGDLVKFAKAEPEETTRNKDVQILREIIQQTTPKPEEISIKETSK